MSKEGITAGESEKNKDPEAGEDTQPNDPEASAGGTVANDPEGAEDAKPNDAQQGETKTVSASKYNADIRRRDREIDDLKAQLKALNDSKAAAGDQSAQLRKELDELKEQLSDEKVASSLTAAGCIDAKAAKARLADYEGDVGKLKEGCPYLFKQEQNRSTGGTRAGSASAPAKSIREALRNR